MGRNEVEDRLGVDFYTDGHVTRTDVAMDDREATFAWITNHVQSTLRSHPLPTPIQEQCDGSLRFIGVENMFQMLLIVRMAVTFVFDLP